MFDFRIPGVTSISADTHKYGYGLKGASVLAFRDKPLRNSQYFFMTDWTGGKYASPGIEGSRSGGLLAATWASLVSIGRDGYLQYAKAIFETAFAMQDAVRSHPELRILGAPTFCFSFTSDEFDIYHVNDFMRTKGWRFNGQQYPNAIHMAVTRPQTQAGLADAFAADLAEAVQYAHEHKDEKPESARDLRRRRRRHDRRGRRVHPLGDGGHARQAPGPAEAVARLPTYIALLRGINVGGRARCRCATCAALFDGLGHTTSAPTSRAATSCSPPRPRPPAAVRSAIETGHRSATSGSRSRSSCARRPSSPSVAEAQSVRRRRVRDVPRRRARPQAGRGDRLRARTRPTSSSCDGREVFVRCPNGYGRTKINNTFFERKLATKATTRNWKTVTTLHEWATG